MLVGAAIAAKTANPVLGLSLALASHFVLDLIPHWNPPIHTQMQRKGKLEIGTKNLMIIDSTTSLMAGLIIAASLSQNFQDINQAIIILLGSFLAVLPDVLEIPYYFWEVKHPAMLRYVALNHSLQTNAPLIPGIITQALVGAAAVWWILG